VSLAFLIAAIVLFAVDLILSFAAPGATPWPSVLLYGGLLCFAASFIPWSAGPWARSA
jgi:hypothetical protein